MASYRQPLAVLVMSVVQTVALGQSANHVIGLPSFRVAGEPLSATQMLDYEPTGNSSDPVAVNRDGTLYRDSEGRTRTELKSPGQRPRRFGVCRLSHRQLRHGRLRSRCRWV